MYDELVKRLREPCQYENCVLCKEAADAIEELSKQLAYYHGFDGFLMAHGMFNQVEWTPAEYEPPKEEA